MIGRQREVAEVVERLRGRRLVTLIGPAGIGKTTVALAVAEQVGRAFELGAHVVDLTRIDRPDAVAETLAGQLGFGSFEALVSSPSEQPALVVVDNCEHVTTAAAEAIGELLAACESPTVLATSRSPLDLPEESLVVLGPLGLPERGSNDIDHDAVGLFLERARDAGTDIDVAQLEQVVELCRRLDGVPLALELAAARTRTMQPAEILARLDEGVEVLARPRFRGAERHRSLTATIDWSYRLLPASAADVLDRLGLAAGPFPARLAVAVGTDAGLTPAEATDILQLLVDSSLVVTERTAEATTFRLLETVRAFAARRLEQRDLVDEARRQMADHVVAEAVAVLTAGEARWDTSVFTRLLSMYDNIVAALRGCLADDDEPNRSLVLCAVLWGVVHQGHTEDIGGLAEATLARWPDLSQPFAADAASTAATARCLLGDPAGAIALAEAALAAGTTSPTAPITLRRAMAYSERTLGRRERAMELFEAVSALAAERGLTAFALEAEASCAQLLADGGDVPAGIERAERARAAAAATGSAVNEVWAWSVAARLWMHVDLARGLDEARRALVASRRIEYPAAITVNLRSLAWALTRAGDHRRAAEQLLEMFDAVLARGGVADLRAALFTTAELLHFAGDDSWPPLAATAGALPLVGPAGAGLDGRVDLPATAAAPLGRRDAVVLARTRLRALLADAPTSPSPVPRATGGPGEDADDARLVDRGEFWDITFARRTVHAKASKGLTDLARLLLEPGREVHCLELMGAVGDESSTGAAIDPAARRAYEQRIRDLQGDIDEAEEHHDRGRAERASAELDALVEHLTAALGLGGRVRHRGSSVERARSAVTQRIRSTVRRLGKEHPELGRHLDAAVATGTYCVYRPERPVTWRR